MIKELQIAALVFVLSSCTPLKSDDSARIKDQSAINPKVVSVSTKPSPGASVNNESKVADESIRANDLPKYMGCWAGMEGGDLKVTREKIFDIGSGESSAYKEMPSQPDQPKTLYTGESYLLEAKTDFPNSFLARFVKFAFNSDGTVGIITYDSFEDYGADKFTGMGLFEKKACGQ